MRIIFVIIVLLFQISLFSQNINTSGNGNQPTPQNADVIKIQNFNPVSIEDPRIEITDISFDRKYSPDGKGEILDIFFNIWNQTSEKLDLFIWVFAYEETNAIDTEERKIVPYPRWRVKDPDKRFFITRFIKISPKDIPADKIWNENDPDYKNYNYVIQRMRNAVGNIKYIGDIYPPIWKYISYAVRYPTQGMAVHLYGDQGPTLDKLLYTNYIPPSPEEKRTKIFKHIPDHTFTIEYTRRKTIIRTHHYSAYRADFRFFNMARILIFDAEKAKQFEDQASRELRPGEVPINAIMYYRTFFINQDLKIR